jgi:hypothetical protein
MSKTYSIVGMNHQKSESIVAALKTGDELKLIREPTNKFDANAIAVYCGDQRVGYIPSKQNKVLAGFIDEVGIPTSTMALDSVAVAPIEHLRSVKARFVRSPNSSYPMVQVDD